MLRGPAEWSRSQPSSWPLLRERAHGGRFQTGMRESLMDEQRNLLPLRRA